MTTEKLQEAERELREAGIRPSQFYDVNALGYQIPPPTAGRSGVRQLLDLYKETHEGRVPKEYNLSVSGVVLFDRVGREADERPQPVAPAVEVQEVAVDIKAGIEALHLDEPPPEWGDDWEDDTE